MKTTFFTLSLILAFMTLANATTEHKPGEDMGPIFSSQICFEEMQRLGCGHPREDQEYFVNCFRNNEETLRSGCRSLLKKLYN